MNQLPALGIIGRTRARLRLDDALAVVAIFALCYLMMLVAGS